MQTNMILREAEILLIRALGRNPVVALVGSRQCGKSTLARKIVEKRGNAIFLDLELPSDARKLEEPEWFLGQHADKLICLDEIQRRPDLFPLLRALVDQDRRPGRFLLLGSASQDLIRQEGESLAGRIHYMELTPFSVAETEQALSDQALQMHWWRGGYPRSILAVDDDESRQWLRDFITTYCARDLPLLGYAISSSAIQRCWQMLAHCQGSSLNSSKLGQSLGVSNQTVRRYLDILEQSFMMRALTPMNLNTKKRLVKAPKTYVRDSGILHTLLEINSFEELFGHPIYGASWEGWCIEQICRTQPGWRAFYYRDSAGAEIDLILEKGSRRRAFEFKASLSPKLNRGTKSALELVKPEKTWLVAPLQEAGYETPKAKVCGIKELLEELGSE